MSALINLGTSWLAFEAGDSFPTACIVRQKNAEASAAPAMRVQRNDLIRPRIDDCASSMEPHA